MVYSKKEKNMSLLPIVYTSLMVVGGLLFFAVIISYFSFKIKGTPEQKPGRHSSLPNYYNKPASYPSYNSYNVSAPQLAYQTPKTYRADSREYEDFYQKSPGSRRHDLSISKVEMYDRNKKYRSNIQVLNKTNVNPKFYSSDYSEDKLLSFYSE